MTLTDHASSYVDMKRATGLSFVEDASILNDFASHAEAQGDEFIRVITALDWVSRTPSQPRRVRKLHTVCGLARHLHVEDERHEVPHHDALGPSTYHRKPPHLLSLDEVGSIMSAALDLPPAGSITPHTMHTLIGLLAATGMRRSEAVKLRILDLTEDGIEIRHAKFNKARLVPLHDTVKKEINAYLGKRGPGAPDDPLFIMPSGQSVKPKYLTDTFIRLARSVGLRGEPGKPGPRLHDLRHSFATRVLTGLEANNRRDISRHMLALSTYLGHTNIADTYWYLQATPVLLDQISAATERLYLERKNHD